MRHLIFISHANSRRDNEFAQWLALQLAKEGYDVWCDQTKLLGGEHHWPEIEEAINHSAKFLYVLTNESNTSSPLNGETRELSVAQAAERREELKRFIIPLCIETLDSAPSIKLTGINIIDFVRRGWARGLSDLLDRLEEDDVHKILGDGPEKVTSWWRRHYSAEQGVINMDEDCLSNWFPFYTLPGELYYHSLSKYEVDAIDPETLPYPAFINAN